MYRAITLTMALAILGVSRAEAAVVFDFTGSGGNLGTSETFVGSDGVTSVTLTGWKGTNNANAPFTFGSGGLSTRSIHQSNSGVGVGGQLDGSPASSAELLRLRFGQDVRLMQVVFGAIGGNDNWDMSIDNIDIGIVSTYGSDLLDDDSVYPGGVLDVGSSVQFRPASGSYFDLPSGQDFAFYTNQTNDDYRIKSVTAALVEAQPEPASVLIWGLLGGVGCAAVYWRRRKRAERS